MVFFFSCWMVVFCFLILMKFLIFGILGWWDVMVLVSCCLCVCLLDICSCLVVVFGVRGVCVIWCSSLNWLII